MMNKDVQIVLFFSKNTYYNATRLAAKINEKIEVLKEAMVLPQNGQKKDEPIILFNQNEDFQVTLNYEAMTLLYRSEKKEEGKKILLKLLEVILDEDLTFTRIGYISTNELAKKNVQLFKDSAFKIEEIKKSEDFQLSWYTPIMLSATKVNLWQKYLTDSMQTDKLIAIFDVNTPLEEEYLITIDFVDNFIEKTEELISKKIEGIGNNE